MERTRVSDFDGQGHAMATMTFFAVDGDGVWTEAIRVASGIAVDHAVVREDRQAGVADAHAVGGVAAYLGGVPGQRGGAEDSTCRAGSSFGGAVDYGP